MTNQEKECPNCGATENNWEKHCSDCKKEFCYKCVDEHICHTPQPYKDSEEKKLLDRNMNQIIDNQKLSSMPIFNQPKECEICKTSILNEEWKICPDCSVRIGTPQPKEWAELREMFKEEVVSKNYGRWDWYSEMLHLISQNFISKSELRKEIDKIKRGFVTQPAEYEGSDANVWREGYNLALEDLKVALKLDKEETPPQQ
mgnify:CR=1 FL=1